jgi:hypothetical protein
VRVPSYALTIVGLTLLASCVADERQGEELEEPIVGGQFDTKDPAVVAINIEFTGMAVCTGTLIATDAVLTAGHCPLDHIWVRQGSNVRGLGWLSHVGVKEGVKHPQFTAEGKPYDVALLHLEHGLDGVSPVLLSDRPLDANDVGATIRHVGFGTTGDDWHYIENIASGGLKREVSHPITKVDDNFFWSGAEGKQTCLFDSGGPALRVIGHVERIIGIVSDGEDCHSDGWDTRIDRPDIVSWIDAQLATWQLQRP